MFKRNIVHVVYRENNEMKTKGFRFINLASDFMEKINKRKNVKILDLVIG
jgi:hypothetical protein